MTDGYERVFEEKISSRESNRKALREAFDYCREGDVLVVRLDRLGRSLRELVDLIGALAEFEREIIRERTMAGLESAKARGRRGGRPRVLDANRTQLARSLKGEGDHSVEESAPCSGWAAPPFIGTSARTRAKVQRDGDRA